MKRLKRWMSLFLAANRLRCDGQKSFVVNVEFKSRGSDGVSKVGETRVAGRQSKRKRDETVEKVEKVGLNFAENGHQNREDFG